MADTSLRDGLKKELNKAIHRKVVINKVQVEVIRWRVTDKHYGITRIYDTFLEAKEAAYEDSIIVTSFTDFINRFEVIDMHYGTQKLTKV